MVYLLCEIVIMQAYQNNSNIHLEKVSVQSPEIILFFSDAFPFAKITDGPNSKQGCGGEVRQEPHLNHHLPKYPSFACPSTPDAKTGSKVGVKED